jgi:predicted nucleotidyltransferase
MLTAPPVAEITQTIVERFHPRRIIVFGSYARRSARPDSDLDLFVEMESDLKPAQRAAQIARVFGIRPWAMDVIVYTPDEMARERHRVGSLMSIIEAEGQVLYERAA